MLNAAPASPPVPRPEWIAHRGESHLAPENTMAAVRLAWELGADAVEFDCHLTADGKLAVIHDFDTSRTAGGRKLVVKDSTLDALRAIDVGAWKGAAYAGERIPTIDEVLATVPPGKRLFIEVKVGPEAVPALADAIERSGKTADQLVVISFKERTIAETKRRLPGIKAYWLASLKRDEQTGRWSPTLNELIATARAVNADGLDLSAKEPIDAAFVAKVKAAGLGMYVWTVDDPAEAQRLVDCGVDGVTTNRPAWIRERVK
jgi:glycerophosphoryl diester phosphodiesterase